MTVTTTSARHILLRFGEPARLPEALLGALRDEVVLAGWVRASGVLADVQLRAFDPRAGSPGATRYLAGPVQAIVLEGSVGLANGDVTCGLRAVLARETESGLETIAGEIVEARVVALEAMVTALDEAAAARALDRTGVWLFDLGGVSRPAAAAAPPPKPPPPQPPPAWAEAARVSDDAPPPPKPAGPRPSATFTPQAMPQRPVKPAQTYEDVVYPDAGDLCEHFAFGKCEVVKSDGDRLHVRLGKDGRIKEIALDMLKVTPLPEDPAAPGKRHFKLDRKL